MLRGSFGLHERLVLREWSYFQALRSQPLLTRPMSTVIPTCNMKHIKAYIFVYWLYFALPGLRNSLEWGVTYAAIQQRPI